MNSKGFGAFSRAEKILAVTPRRNEKSADRRLRDARLCA
jgi:hypothetical protein